MARSEEGWLDGDATRSVRPYTATGGRTSPSIQLDLLSMVVATGSSTGTHLEPDYEQVLGLCRNAASVAEVAALLRLPVAVAKVLVADLAEWGALHVSPPLSAAEASSRQLLERLLDGLQNAL